MKNFIMIGGGDLGREATWIFERMNANNPMYKHIGFVDDGYKDLGDTVDGYPVLGPVDYLLDIKEPTAICCSINNGRVKEKIMNKVLQNKFLEPINIIDPTVIIGRDTTIGTGCIFSVNVVISINCTIGDNVVLNIACDLGHDDVMGNNVTISPGCRISGHCTIGESSYIGTGASIVQGKTICSDVTLGAGAVLAKDIDEPGTYVGVPVKKIK